ncbi:MAG TPA: hypothetical protein VKY36_02565 [Moheibacter sp.]|nr:hypothetical protein [Moheibacter sp.]
MKKIISILILSFLILSCKNDDDGTNSELPEITTEGKNTFGCKIDGVTFLPVEDLYGWHDPTENLIAHYGYDEYYYGGYAFNIRASNELLDKSISLKMSDSEIPLNEGSTYPLELEIDDNFNAVYHHWDSDSNLYYDYITNEEYSGEMTILKLDEDNKIIAGTFWFDCVDISTGKTSRITEGRFDLKYLEYW